MTWTMSAASIQVSPEVATLIERIAWAQVVTAAGTAIVALFAIGLGLVLLWAFRSITRTVSRLERSVERLAPRAEPILDRAARVAEDAGEVSHSVRRTIEDLVETVRELNVQLRDLSVSAEDRVRRIGAVLAVVQRETEELLIDAAATARGAQVTASTLRSPAPHGAKPAPTDDGSPTDAAG